MVRALSWIEMAAKMLSHDDSMLLPPHTASVDDDGNPSIAVFDAGLRGSFGWRETEAKRLCAAVAGTWPPPKTASNFIHADPPSAVSNNSIFRRAELADGSIGSAESKGNFP